MLKNILVLCLVFNACMAYTATVSQPAVDVGMTGTISDLDEVTLSVFQWFRDILRWYTTVIQQLQASLLELPELKSFPNLPANFTIDDIGNAITDWITVNQKSIQAAINKALGGLDNFPAYPDIFSKIANQYIQYFKKVPDSVMKVFENIAKSIAASVNNMVQEMIKEAVASAFPQIKLNIPKIQLFPTNTLPKLFGL
ncbi:uncharacterized protein [Diabrotica undecimpunctata]|uniref:uncharacterized protein isoform X2 n=1 Tax=Diabrotica undecimpunctata TaxID=50387 RepID=UPI003B63D5D0